MNFQQYQAKTTETAADNGIEILLLGLAGEAGEVCDYMKKVLGHGHELDLVNLQSELGDVLWYLAQICQKTGLDLEMVAVANLAKLAERYPDGFDPERSKNRAEYSGGVDVTLPPSTLTPVQINVPQGG